MAFQDMLRNVKQVMEFQTFLSPKILQDGHDGAVMGSGAWRLVLVEVEKRFDSPTRTH